MCLNVKITANKFIYNSIKMQISKTYKCNKF